jgi:hypothetical protein
MPRLLMLDLLLVLVVLLVFFDNNSGTQSTSFECHPRFSFNAASFFVDEDGDVLKYRIDGPNHFPFFNITTICALFSAVYRPLSSLLFAPFLQGISNTQTSPWFSKLMHF